jgi:hypothetical protein
MSSTAAYILLVYFVSLAVGGAMREFSNLKSCKSANAHMQTLALNYSYSAKSVCLAKDVTQ